MQWSNIRWCSSLKNLFCLKLKTPFVCATIIFQGPRQRWSFHSIWSADRSWPPFSSRLTRCCFLVGLAAEPPFCLLAAIRQNVRPQRCPSVCCCELFWPLPVSCVDISVSLFSVTQCHSPLFPVISRCLASNAGKTENSCVKFVHFRNNIKATFIMNSFRCTVYKVAQVYL